MYNGVVNSKAAFRPTPFASRLTLIVALVALIGLFVFPYATFGRATGNATAALQLFPGGIQDFTTFLPKAPPDLSLALGLGWATFGLLLLSGYAALRRESWLWMVGAVGLVVGIGAIVALKSSLGAAIAELVAKNFKLNKIIYVAGGANLGMVLPLAAFLIALIGGVSGIPMWRTRLERLRGALVPLVSILLAVAVGALLVVIIQSVPTNLKVPLSAWQGWLGKVDVVYFVYTTLFAPLTNIPDTFQSLLLATPLILTGLSVAFGFRAGLFNIGAPGQMLMGAIAVMLVSVYIKLPGILLAPLCVIAAALGGGLWGGLVGWLKARFGSSEVINTIMLNYVASSLLIFLIGSRTVSFFGKTYPLPFIADGGEAKSKPLELGAQLPTLPGLLGLDNPNTVFPFSPVLGLLLFGILAYFLRGPRRWLFALGGGLLVTALFWVPLNIRGDFRLGSNNLNVAFFIAQLAAVFYGIFLWRTARGYEVRAVGLSPKAAEYGGINVARNVILAMFISGAFAGLTATHYVMGRALDEYAVKQSIPTSVGFDGITIALLGQGTPVGIVVSSIFFGVLDTGGLYADQKLDALSRDIVTVLKALIVLFIAAQGFLARRIISPPPALEPSKPTPLAVGSSEAKAEVA